MTRCKRQLDATEFWKSLLSPNPRFLWCTVSDLSKRERKGDASFECSQEQVEVSRDCSPSTFNILILLTFEINDLPPGISQDRAAVVRLAGFRV